MMRPGETEYAVGIAVVARQVGRCDRRAVRAVQAQLEGGKAIRRKRSGGSRSKTEKEALQNQSVNDRNAGQPAPKASLCRARLSWLDAHPAIALRKCAPAFKTGGARGVN
jgi:hypothetical protein